MCKALAKPKQEEATKISESSGFLLLKVHITSNNGMFVLVVIVIMAFIIGALIYFYWKSWKAQARRGNHPDRSPYHFNEFKLPRIHPRPSCYMLACITYIQDEEMPWIMSQRYDSLDEFKARLHGCETYSTSTGCICEELHHSVGVEV